MPKVDRRTELEKTHAQREKEWREQDSLRAAALKNRDRAIDRDGDGVRDSRDPVDNRKL